MSQVKIKKHLLFNYSKPFIVAEVGINHNGSLKKAFKMIDVAKAAGCTAVKFQTYKAAELVNDRKLIFNYYSQNKRISEPMLDMFKRYELNNKDWIKIRKYCDKKRIIFFSTPQNLSDLKLLEKLGIPAIKVGSDDFTNIDLIKSYSKFNKVLILSMGMSSERDIKNILSIRGLNKKKLIFLICTSQYPTPYKDVNLKKIHNLKKILGDIPIGFSDHTQDNIASIMAVSLGCCFFEKHFTLNNNFKGPDHWFSLNPVQLKSWVKAIKSAYTSMGSSKLCPTHLELKNLKSFRRKIVIKNKVKIGQVLNRGDFVFKRVSDKKSVDSSQIYKIVGSKAKKNYKPGDVFKI